MAFVIWCNTRYCDALVFAFSKRIVWVTDCFPHLGTSDLLHGTVNIGTGERDELAKTLAEHDDVDAIWYAGPKEGHAAVQKASAANMKRTWVLPAAGVLPETGGVLREATQVKNVWVPYGE